jgi:hypothetical protein
MARSISACSRAAMSAPIASARFDVELLVARSESVSTTAAVIVRPFDGDLAQ